jgi:hypothetical protein
MQKLCTQCLRKAKDFFTFIYFLSKQKGLVHVRWRGTLYRVTTEGGGGGQNKAGL